MKDEQKQQLKKYKEKLNKELEIDTKKIESQFESKLAKERQETSKANLKTAQLEIQNQTLQQQVENER